MVARAHRRRPTLRRDELTRELVHAALVDRVEEIARDVGRLRRRFASNDGAWTGIYIADRLADNVETVHGMLHLSAADLVAATFPGDDDAISAAIDHVDRRTRQLHALLGRDR